MAPDPFVFLIVRQSWVFKLAIIAARGNRTPECLACSLRHRCLNSCGCTNRAASGFIDRVSPFLCSLERLCIEEADAMAEQLYAERCPAFMQEFYGEAALSAGRQFHS